jgi:hypothetical protein
MTFHGVDLLQESGDGEPKASGPQGCTIKHSSRLIEAVKIVPSGCLLKQCVIRLKFCVTSGVAAAP